LLAAVGKLVFRVVIAGADCSSLSDRLEDGLAGLGRLMPQLPNKEGAL
jgi:hypothetical protein